MLTSLLLSTAQPPLGVAFALATATFWAISPMFMASVGRQIGALHTNLLRILLAALVLLCVVLPLDLWLHGATLPTRPQLGWLIASGFGGMVIGDVFFYEALVLIGPRRAIKMNTLAPVFALLLAWFINQEALSSRTLAGAGLVIAAIMYAVFRQTEASAWSAAAEPPSMGMAGFLVGLGAAFCTGLGSVLARKAYQASPDAPLDPIVATTIRVGTAACFLWLWPLFRGQTGKVLSHLRKPDLRLRLVCGVIGGPLAGMLCYITALKFAPAGIVSTLVATSPLITMPILAFKYRLRITWDIIAATVLAIVGVGIISLKN